MEFRDRESSGSIVRNNLKRHNGSLVAGIMPLEIETDRYVNTPREKRFCTICNIDLVEDEYHFLFTCIAYQRERSLFYM